MSLLGNILWIILGGGIFILFEYLVGGVFLCLTIIGIPFGKEIIQKEKAAGCLNTLMNIMWIILFGLAITLTHLFFAVLCAITLIGIPFAKQHMKLVALGLTPFGHEFK